MKKSTFFSLVILYGAATVGHADEVIGRAPNNLVGQALGGWAGFLAGGGMAGPVGALAVGAVGVWMGGEIQETSGLSEQAYLVEQATGEIQQIRSPNRQWKIGDQVIIKAQRLHSVQSDPSFNQAQTSILPLSEGSL